MPRSRRADESFYMVSERFVDECLAHEGSLFSSDQPIWSAGPIGELYERVVENPDFSKGPDFAQKLRGQLEGASRDVVQLAAEVLLVLLLPQDTRPEIKLQSIMAVLDASPPPPVVPGGIEVALEHGIASYGAALTHRYPQYVFLLEFAREWSTFDPIIRSRLLSDAGHFYEFVFSLPRKGASAQVEALLHMVFPDQFEPIVSVDVKQKIVKTFADRGGDESLPRDRRIALIRQSLSEEYGEDFSFYDPAVRAHWQLVGNEGASVAGSAGPAIHLVVKWSAQYGPETVDEHRAVAERAGSVWWGLIGSLARAKLSTRAVDAIRAQLHRGEPTHVFISGPSCWRTTLLDIAILRDEVEPELIPSYYPSELRHGLWVKLADFEPIDRSWLTEHLELASAPGLPLSAGALGNQTNPLMVHEQQSPRDYARGDYVAPSLSEIEEQILSSGLALAPGTLRRYHVSLKTRGFVILAGISGGGKTWLAEAYADAVGAERLVVPVAPHWTTNEDLLGYNDPLHDVYRHTNFSSFLLDAEREWLEAREAGQQPRPFHLILDEMNLARVEYYFAKFLSAMEARARHDTATLVLAESREVALTPNLLITGTVNVDETTFGFADKVYDRAQFVELQVPRELLATHVDGKVFAGALLEAWDAVQAVAPFAFRVLDEIDLYIEESAAVGVDWDEAFDDQLLQKILPKIKGTDRHIGDALQALAAQTRTRFPRSHEKVTTMLEAFKAHGFVSYF